MNPGPFSLIFSICVCLATSPASGSPLSIEMVFVGNAGNAPDLRYNLDVRPSGFGSVPYEFLMGKFETTAGAYTAFLNSVAADDPNGLYNPAMADPTYYVRGCNIQRTGEPGAYTYTVAPDWADRPVNYIGIWDAARFANWLHNGQPVGPQGPHTTELGAYSGIGDSATFARQPGARFFIPNEDEWYKAAYHNASAGLSGSYYDYPTSSNEIPGIDVNELTNPGNNANYYHYPDPDGPAIGEPYFRTVVGEFEKSRSPYGTYDQAGNVAEWVETRFGANQWGWRGGGTGENHLYLRADSRNSSPAEDNPALTFRIAAVPEPNNSILVISGAVVALLAMRRRRRGASSDDASY